MKERMRQAQEMATTCGYGRLFLVYVGGLGGIMSAWALLVAARYFDWNLPTWGAVALCLPVPVAVSAQCAVTVRHLRRNRSRTMEMRYLTFNPGMDMASGFHGWFLVVCGCGFGWILSDYSALAAAASLASAAVSAVAVAAFKVSGLGLHHATETWLAEPTHNHVSAVDSPESRVPSQRLWTALARQRSREGPSTAQGHQTVGQVIDREDGWDAIGDHAQVKAAVVYPELLPDEREYLAMAYGYGDAVRRQVVGHGLTGPENAGVDGVGLVLLSQGIWYLSVQMARVGLDVRGSKPCSMSLEERVDQVALQVVSGYIGAWADEDLFASAREARVLTAP